MSTNDRATDDAPAISEDLSSLQNSHVQSGETNGKDVAWVTPPPDHDEAAASDPQLPPFDMAPLLAAMDALVTRFDYLERGFESKIKYDQSKEQIIDTLHKELEEHRDGMHFRVLRPIFIDLIAMRDDFERLARQGDAATDASETETRLWRNLLSFRDTVEEILYRHGVESFTEEGDEFVARRQRSIKRVPTTDPALDRRVAESLHSGFVYEERVLRPQLVTTYHYQPDTALN